MTLPRGRINLRSPANRRHRLCPDRGWWMALPGWMGGSKFYDLLGLNHGTLTNMGTVVATTTPDSSGNGHTGTLVNGPVASTDVPSVIAATSKQSLSLAAAGSQYVNVPAAVVATRPLTLGCWFKAATNTVGTLLSIDDQASSQDFFRLVIVNGVLWANEKAHQPEAKAISAGFTGNVWHHAAAVFTSQTARTVYLDGVAVSDAGDAAADQAGLAATHIGSLSAATQFFDGKLDDCFVVGSALTPTQIANLANGTLDPATLSPAGLWRFETQDATPTSGWRGSSRPGGYGELRFPGVSEYVVGSQFVTNGAARLTLCCWALTTSANETYLVSFPYAGSGSNGVDFRIGNGAHVRAIVTTTLSQPDVDMGVGADGTWRHLAVTFDGADVRTYVDGVPGATAACTGTVATPANEFNFGRFGSFGGYAACRLDDIRLYSWGLSATDVREVRDNSRLGCPAILRRAYRRVPDAQGAGAVLLEFPVAAVPEVA